jgi:hypothetical protein
VEKVGLANVSAFQGENRRSDYGGSRPRHLIVEQSIVHPEKADPNIMSRHVANVGRCGGATRKGLMMKVADDEDLLIREAKYTHILG